MGISCKKPSRANNGKAAGVVVFLLNTQLAVKTIAANPAMLDSYNAGIKPDDACIIKAYSHTAKYGVTLEASTVKLREVFGAIGLTIWKKLFIRVAQGGWSKTYQRRFDSIWALNEQVHNQLELRKISKHVRGNLTPTAFLEILADIEPMVVSHVGVSLSFTDDDYARIRKGPKKLIGESARKEVLAKQRAIMALAAEHNWANTDRIIARDELTEHVTRATAAS